MILGEVHFLFLSRKKLGQLVLKIADPRWISVPASLRSWKELCYMNVWMSERIHCGWELRWGTVSGDQTVGRDFQCCRLTILLVLLLGHHHPDGCCGIGSAKTSLGEAFRASCSEMLGWILVLQRERFVKFVKKRYSDLFEYFSQEVTFHLKSSL